MKQHELIKSCLKEQPNFYNFVRLYQFWRKTCEILQIKISFINLENREIILPAKTTKGGIHLRKIIIDNGLFDKKMNL
jgi:hypothetical protein